jgi:hypothetical protein
MSGPDTRRDHACKKAENPHLSSSPLGKCAMTNPSRNPS